MAGSWGLRLGTALLFDDVRDTATILERRRMAREIHDGIAQELVSLGYLIDGIAGESRVAESGLTGQISELRSHVTRVVTELKLSLFELRSEAHQRGGLGAALSDHMQTVGRSSGATVHLVLDEGPTRLPAAVEAELLRLAEGCVSLASRHAGAETIWLECQVRPPEALLRIEHDGVGSNDVQGAEALTEGIRERAARLHATLEFNSRTPRGGAVEIRLSGPDGSSALRPDSLHELESAEPCTA
jgi:signal transduction histidine kinase